jgi:lysozyme
MNKARLIAAAIAVSATGVAFISKHEGLRTSAYVDPVGVVTVCYGHTGTARLGQVFSHEACQGLLREDLREAERAVKRFISVPLPQPTFDALVSFTFNVGAGNLQRSTLRRKANAGDLVGACNEILKWRYARGVVLPGIVTRRAAEHRMCLSGLE